MTEQVTIDKAKILRRAAEIVEERGWGTHTIDLLRADGPCCILKACANALLEDGYTFIGVDEYEELRKLSFYQSLKEVGAWGAYTDHQDSSFSPFEWNDRLPDSTKENCELSKQLVIDKLLEAASLEENKSTDESSS